VRECNATPEGIHRPIRRSPVPSQKGIDICWKSVKQHFLTQPLFVLTGQFVYHSTARVETLIVGAQELGHKQIILDFSGITGIDSIVLWHLFLWHHKMQPHGLQLSIVNPQPRIREVLEQSHISDLILVPQIWRPSNKMALLKKACNDL
jgi:anti-anti-sigma regulatory factor